MNNDSLAFTEQRSFDLDATIKRLTDNANKVHAFVAKLPIIASAFDRCYWIHCYDDASIIAECKTREDFAPVRALHKGVWEKQPQENNMRYKACIDGIWISVIVGELPPSCKLIQKRKLVPEHEEVEYEMVCK